MHVSATHKDLSSTFCLTISDFDFFFNFFICGLVFRPERKESNAILSLLTSVTFSLPMPSDLRQKHASRNKTITSELSFLPPPPPPSHSSPLHSFFARLCVCVCVRACACVRACVRACVCVWGGGGEEKHNIMFRTLILSCCVCIFVDLAKRGVFTIVCEISRCRK